MCLLKKPFMTTTNCGFPAMLVDRLLILSKKERNPGNEARARNILAEMGVFILNLGDPWIGSAVNEVTIVEQMAVTLNGWTKYFFGNNLKYCTLIKKIFFYY
jgi:hypothetical protein